MFYLDINSLIGKAMEKILSLQPNQIAVIGESINECRKQIHVWLFNQGTPKFSQNYHRSFVNNRIALENGRGYYYYRCGECYEKTPLDTFHCQSMPQVSREFMYYGTCIKCGEYLQYDSGDYDYENLSEHHKEQYTGPCCGKTWSGNNIMVFGQYIQKYFRRKVNKYGLEIPGSVDEFMDDVKRYLEKKEIHVIDAPDRPMSKVEFMEYINSRV